MRALLIQRSERGNDMKKKPTDNRHLKTIINHADEILEDYDASPFTTDAFKLLKDKISEYIVELVNESIKISKRHSSENVLIDHVDLANRFLVTSRKKKIYRYYETLGGIITGVSSTVLIAIYSASVSVPHAEVVKGIMYLLILIGCILMYVSLRNE
jgi:hypothetical protein